jgi:hypothetical protein
MGKYTPGPWTFLGLVERDEVESWTVQCADKRYVRCEGRTGNEAEANARLIAAAPDLLEALKNLMRTFDECTQPHDHEQWVEFVQDAAAVIAKAEGR